MRPLIGVLALLFAFLGCSSEGNSSASGGSCGFAPASVGASGCDECAACCGQGLVAGNLPLDPPGCGGQCQVSFCPGGCNGTTCLGYQAGPNGGVGNCAASHLTAGAGLLNDAGVAIEIGQVINGGTGTGGCVDLEHVGGTTGGAPVVASDTIVLATSAAAACAVTADAGLQSTTNAAALAVSLASNFAGTVAVTPNCAVLTTWSAGGVTRTPATSGQLSINLSQPGGGFIGSYSIAFGSDVEQGTFIAPDCDICLTPP